MRIESCMVQVLDQAHLSTGTFTQAHPASLLRADRESREETMKLAAKTELNSD